MFAMERRNIGFFLFLAVAFLSCGKGDSSNNIYTLYLVKTWDGIMVSPKDIVPVSFSLGSLDNKSLIVTFNSTLFMDAEKETFTPEVFGIMFKNSENRYVQIEVDSANGYFVKIFDSFDNKLETKEELKVIYQSYLNNFTWNGTITVPLEYLPRATDEIAAYANLTTAPSHKKQILTLQSITNGIKAPLPNLHKEPFFQDISFQQYLPNVSQTLTQWSDLWQNLLHVTAGGNTVHPNTTDVSHFHDGHNVASSLFKFPLAIGLCLIIFISSL